MKLSYQNFENKAIAFTCRNSSSNFRKCRFRHLGRSSDNQNLKKFFEF